MKKLMTMIAAVAMSFGLFADVEPFSISFEAAEGVGGTGKGVDTTAMTFDAANADGWTWAGDPLSLEAYGAAPYVYTTNRRDIEFDGGTENLNYLKLATGTEELERTMGTDNIFVDQLVKFTGFEEFQTNLVNGTKIAVWASGIENDTDVIGETNLYVTVGKVATGHSVEQVALKIDLDDFELEKWYRLTIKSIGNIYSAAGSDSARAGFIVYIDGVQVASSDDDATQLIPEDWQSEMTSAAKGYMGKGQLFTSIDTTDAVFTSVAYKGIGAIDDVILDDKGPDFCQTVPVTIDPVTGAVIDQVLDQDGNVVTAGQDGKYELAPGDFQIVWKNAENYMPFTKTIDHNTGDTQPIDDSTALEEDIEEVVATVNGVPFASLEAALAKVQELELTEAKIQVVITKDCDPVTVAEGTFSFTKNTRIDITPATSYWFVSGGATLLADIQAEATFEMDYGCAMTYAGTVAGTLIADEITIPAASAITLDVTGEIIVAEETDITPVDGYKLVKTEISGGDYDGMYSYTVEEEAADVVEIVGTGAKYKSLDAAIEEAKEGDELMLLDSIELTALVTIDKAITLDLNTKTITANSATGVFKFTTAASGFEVKNGSITSGLEEYAAEELIEIIDAAGKLTGLTINSANYQYGVVATTDGNKDIMRTPFAGKIVCEGVSVTGGRSCLFYTDYIPMDLINCTAIQAGDIDHPDWYNCAVSASWGATVTVKSGTYSAKYVLNENSSPAKIVVEGGVFTGTVKDWGLDAVTYGDYGTHEWEIKAGDFSDTNIPVEYLANTVDAGYKPAWVDSETTPGYKTPGTEAITYQVTYADGGADGGTAVAAQDYTLETKDLAAAANTWTKTDYEFVGWTNAVGGAIIKAGEALTPVVGGIALTAVWEAKAKPVDPVDPEEPQVCDDEDEAKAKADAINADKSAMIKSPETAGLTGEAHTAYANKFVAVAEGNTVTVQLIPAEKEALETQAKQDTAQIPVSTIAAATDATAQEITVTPGFYYSVIAADSLEGMKVRSCQVATGSGKLTVSLPHYANSGFYQIKASVKPQSDGAVFAEDK